MKRIKELCAKAKRLYTSLNLSKQWVNPHGGSARFSGKPAQLACWNCGGNHHLKDCKEPKNQGRIDDAKKKWQQAKKNGGEWQSRSHSGGGGGSGGGRKGKQQGGGANSASGLKYANGMWLMKCSKTDGNGKVCGWNTTHSTKFHGSFMSAPHCFPANLPDTHPIWAKVSKAAHGKEGTGVPPPPASGALGALQGGTGDGLVKSLASRTQAVFAEMAKTVSDPDVASTFEKLDKVWGSLN